MKYLSTLLQILLLSSLQSVRELKTGLKIREPEPPFRCTKSSLRLLAEPPEVAGQQRSPWLAENSEEEHHSIQHVWNRHLIDPVTEGERWSVSPGLHRCTSPAATGSTSLPFPKWHAQWRQQWGYHSLTWKATLFLHSGQSIPVPGLFNYLKTDMPVLYVITLAISLWKWRLQRQLPKQHVNALFRSKETKMETFTLQEGENKANLTEMCPF